MNLRKRWLVILLIFLMLASVGAGAILLYQNSRIPECTYIGDGSLQTPDGHGLGYRPTPFQSQLIIGEDNDSGEGSLQTIDGYGLGYRPPPF